MTVILSPHTGTLLNGLRDVYYRVKRSRVGRPVISLRVLHRTKVVFTKSDGQRDVTTGLPASPDTAYAITSLSTMFVACAVGILVDEGRMA